MGDCDFENSEPPNRHLVHVRPGLDDLESVTGVYPEGCNVGQEITATHFRHYDFHRFERLLRQEMELLHEWFQSGRFSRRRSISGLELETWLVDASGQPMPINDEILGRLKSPSVVHELSKFNIEFNVDPQPLAGRGLESLSRELSQTWRQCEHVAAELGSSVVAIGTLPTITEEMLSLRNISSLQRYRALNEQVLRLRQGSPIHLVIDGPERLETEHRDVMLEAGTTSLQLHLQVAPEESVRALNAAAIVSAPLVSLSANSPWLFGRLLWDETRIPLFEQSVDVGGGRLPRVTFGSEYARDSLEACFVENQECYPVLLPLTLDESSQRLVHLRLHNGTLWRWNRPLIGFDDDGTPHLRIEHRVMPAGPTVVDMAANTAFYYGLMEALIHQEPSPESQLPFFTARDNFYAAARHGLSAQAAWLDGKIWPIRSLILELLLPLAAAGLSRLGVDSDLADRWLAIIAERVAAGQNGAAWQRQFAERRGRDLALLTREYRTRQQSGEPVHTWEQ